MKYMLVTFSKVEENQRIPADVETNKRFWDMMMNADKKDYERICAEFGVSDLESVLKKLEERKRERMRNKCKVGKLSDLKVDTIRHLLKSCLFCFTAVLVIYKTLAMVLTGRSSNEVQLKSAKELLKYLLHNPF